MRLGNPKPPTRFTLQVLLLVFADLAVVFALVGARHRQLSVQDLVLRDLGGAIEQAVWNQSGAITEVRMKPRCPITPGVELAHLSSLKHLEKLDLCEARISDEVLADVSAIRHLRHLDLSGTSVTDAGLRRLASLADLESLDLSRTGITDDGLRQLCVLGALRVVRAEKTQATAQGIEQFSHLLPNCVVLSDVRATRLARPASDPRADEAPAANEIFFGVEPAAAVSATSAKARAATENPPQAADLTIGLPQNVADRIRELEQEYAAENRNQPR